jgi:hypothetical protein
MRPIRTIVPLALGLVALAVAGCHCDWRSSSVPLER